MADPTGPPLVRGNPAPKGFAESVTTWLERYVAQEEMRDGSMSTAKRFRFNAVSEASLTAKVAGDHDPRIRLLHRAGSVVHGGHPVTWEPTCEQVVVVHSAGFDPENPLTGSILLDALCHAAVVDMQAALEREVKKMRESVNTPTAALETRAEEAERERDQLKAERDQAQAHAESLVTRMHEERELRRKFQRLMLNGGELPADNGDSRESTTVEPERKRNLPTGVRQRPNGYQAYWRENGQQKQKDGFDTPEKAAAHRQKALTQLDRQNVASEAQTARYDDKTTEEIAVEEARGRAA